VTSATHDWDATTYDRVAAPQESWAREVLERLPLRGDETVLDAGSGSGRVTRLLIERLSEGRVIGVDSSPSMIAKARESLGPGVELIESDLLELELERPVDAVFSNATFHWIADHDRLFQVLHDCLVPGGRLVAQCGGKGNVAKVVEVAAAVAGEQRFEPHFKGWERPLWLFATAEETEARLRAAGFEDERCWLESKPTRVAAEDSRAYLATACIGPLLDLLPVELHGGFVEAVRERLPDPTAFGYVRLNIEARRP
jgi:trans-aconitate 2-methyltransferase